MHALMSDAFIRLGCTWTSTRGLFAFSVEILEGCFESEELEAGTLTLLDTVIDAECETENVKKILHVIYPHQVCGRNIMTVELMIIHNLRCT